MAMVGTAREQVRQLPVVKFQESMRKERVATTLDVLVDAIGLATGSPAPIAKGLVKRGFYDWVTANRQKATPYIRNKLGSIIESLPQAAYDPVKKFSFEPTSIKMFRAGPAAMDPGNPFSGMIRTSTQAPPRKNIVKEVMFRPDDMEQAAKLFNDTSFFPTGFAHELAHASFWGDMPKEIMSETSKKAALLRHTAKKKGFAAHEIYDLFDPLELHARKTSQEALPLMREFYGKGSVLPDDMWVELSKRSLEDALNASEGLLQSLNKLPDIRRPGNEIADRVRMQDTRQWLQKKGFWEPWRPPSWGE